MTMEKEKTTDALKIAVQMEIDGKEFYTRASQNSNTGPGKVLFAKLADEEDIHRQIFISIFESIRSEKGWPEIEFHPDQGQGVRTLFLEAIEKESKNVKVIASETDAVLTARQMEAKTFDFYTLRSREAAEPAEKEFYNLLAAQEQQHNLILADYFEYLNNPAGYFVKKEHPHLD